MLNLRLHRFENTSLLKEWKGQGQPLHALLQAYTIQRPNAQRQGTGHNAPPAFPSGCPTPGVGSPRLSSGQSSPALGSTWRPRPPVHRGNCQCTGSPVVSLRLPPRLVLRFPLLPFRNKMQQEPPELSRRRSSGVAASQAELLEL